MNRLVFLLSIVNELPLIIKNRSLLGMDFITRMVIKDYKGDEQIIQTYAEFVFHTYDYSNITKKIKYDTLLLDIGAHFGEVTHRFLNDDNGYAYMFEVNPNNQKMINKLFRKNKDYDYNNQLLKFGLGDYAHTENLVLNSPFSYEGSLKDTTGKFRHQVEIKPLTIKMIPRYQLYPNIFISLDVEGYEYRVLQGMELFLMQANHEKKHIDLFIEIKDKDTLKDITTFLRHRLNGLKVKKITKEDYLFSNSL